jgi:hypothetical protein
LEVIGVDVGGLVVVGLVVDVDVVGLVVGLDMNISNGMMVMLSGKMVMPFGTIGYALNRALIE